MEEAPYCAICYKLPAKSPYKKIFLQEVQQDPMCVLAVLQNKPDLVVYSVLLGITCITECILWLTQQHPHEKIKAYGVLCVQHKKKKIEEAT